ncbi:hypothetical protein GIS00_14575 [Nakamurella sp. YIM 132087]|uniref:ATP/GTP-binding protein n=1 Tax=Nakamurella alba TaxID=2665158 RepID=A0A7K1FLY1_9ACTN|nr:hypothetical protein [Nakamurella alba]MTD15165.1 hypothetical protein [Nakamurella alba]
MASRAIGQMVAPTPQLHLGPDPDTIAVQIPVWLWITDPGELQVTVAAGGLSVTATGRITSTTWDTHEPVDPADPATLMPPVTCDGLGAPPPDPLPELDVQPACGYTYAWKSTEERTDGTGRWPLTVTANWTVNWVATNGETGTEVLSSSTTEQILVREYRTLLVPPG